MANARNAVIVVVLAGVLAASVIAARKPPLIGIWRSAPGANDQVTLDLRGDGSFAGSEVWVGPTSKPGPNYRMSGKWERRADRLILEEIVYRGLWPRVDRTISVLIRTRYLSWTFGAATFPLSKATSRAS